MANTTNFNWETPDDTDLVKDGAAAIRTLGSAIDTSLVDLKGGTTGQILSKTSNTDMDFTWIANDQGDITGITASAPLTGGGTSGAITVGIQDGTTAQKGAVQLENSTSSTSITTAAVPASVKSAYDLANAAVAKSLIDAKGDLIVGSANDAVARLAVGTDTYILTADSTATNGIKWAAPSGSSGPAFSAYRSSTAQSINQTTWTKVQLNSENFDTASAFDSTTNYRFTPATAGYYHLNANLGFDNSATGRCLVAIYKNGTEYARLLDMSGNYAAPSVGGAALVYLNGSTDYVELFARADNAGTRTIYFGNEYTQFSGVWVRS